MNVSKPKRKFISTDLVVNEWEDISNYYENLLKREWQDEKAFLTWLEDLSEMEAVLEEDMAWRYIKMTIDTRDEGLAQAYNVFVTKIQPNISPLEDQLNKKMMTSVYFKALEKEDAFKIYFRAIRNKLSLFREENVSLEAEIAEKSQQYGALSANQTIDYDGKTLTMQQASLYLKNQDELIRKKVFEKIARRRQEDYDKFDVLFNELLEKRHTVAKNAGFSNFRDYKLQAMGRFDYTVDDCKLFHDSVKKIIVPMVKKIQLERLKELNKKAFKPWDHEVDPFGRPPLSPFKNGNELLDGTIDMFAKIDPYFSDCLSTMNTLGHLDLESKQGKSPGGYNYPLYEIGVPFIFMNAVGSQRDLVTMVHEGGHAVHSFLSRNLQLTGFKSLTSEIAELASMSMELLSMKYWDVFYKNEDDLIRAQKEQLEGILKILPWIAQVDEFQHWLYENPLHSNTQRSDKWVKLCSEYGTGLTDWDGYEELQRNSWQRQLHIFEVPFYYIEYGIAQLGALQVWMNSLEDEKKTVLAYKTALSLGYTKTIPEIYEAAGIQFDFSEKIITDLAIVIDKEISRLTNLSQ